MIEERLVGKYLDSVPAAVPVCLSQVPTHSRALPGSGVLSGSDVPLARLYLGKCRKRALYRGGNEQSKGAL